MLIICAFACEFRPDTEGSHAFALDTARARLALFELLKR